MNLYKNAFENYTEKITEIEGYKSNKHLTEKANDDAHAAQAAQEALALARRPLSRVALFEHSRLSRPSASNGRQRSSHRKCPRAALLQGVRVRLKRKKVNFRSRHMISRATLRETRQTMAFARLVDPGAFYRAITAATESEQADVQSIDQKSPCQYAPWIRESGAKLASLESRTRHPCPPAILTSKKSHWSTPKIPGILIREFRQGV
jgi:hypothetical protein